MVARARHWQFQCPTSVSARGHFHSERISGMSVKILVLQQFAAIGPFPWVWAQKHKNDSVEEAGRFCDRFSSWSR
jgi:hypothetical protein